jgi:hypothetical protein
MFGWYECSAQTVPYSLWLLDGLGSVDPLTVERELIGRYRPENRYNWQVVSLLLPLDFGEKTLILRARIQCPFRFHPI